MSNIQKAVSSAWSTARDANINFHLVEKGSASLLTGIYTNDNEVVNGFYKKPDIVGQGQDTKLFVAYGEVMISPYMVDAGVESSTNDPSSILKTYRFITGDGENEGIVPGPNGTITENIYVKDPNGVPQPVVNSDGRPSLGNVIAASALGAAITSAPKIWNAIKGSTPANAKTASKDPVTGKTIPSRDQQIADKAAEAMSLGKLTDVNDSGKSTDTVLTYNPETQKWEPKAIGTLLGSSLSGTDICGGSGGAGGNGGTGGGGASSAKATIIKSNNYTQAYLIGSINTTISYGYRDDNDTEYIIGTLTYGTDFTDLETLKTKLAEKYRTHFKVSNVSITSYTDDVGNILLYAYMSDNTATTDPSKCGVQQNIHLVLKSGSTYITSQCVDMCFIKSTDLQLRNVVAASTANISATTSTVSKTPTEPVINARYVMDTNIDSPTRSLYVFDSMNVVSGGGTFHTGPYNTGPELQYLGYSFNTTLSGGSSGSIVSATNPTFSPSTPTLTYTPPSWASLFWIGGTYNGSEYLMFGVDSSGNVRTIKSTDGVTWTQGATSFPNQLNVLNLSTSPPNASVVWDGSQYCAVLSLLQSGLGLGIFTSPDGITWTLRHTATLPTGGNNFTIAWNGSVFCVMMTSNTTSGFILLTSPTGVTWTSRTPVTGFAANDLIWNGTKFVAVGRIATGNPGAGAACMTSTNGITWASSAMPLTGATVGSTNDGYWSCASNNSGLIVASNRVYVGSGSYRIMVYSTDNGSTWSLATISGTVALEFCAWNGSCFLGIRDNIVTSSTDGINWTTLSTVSLGSSTPSFKPLAGGGKFVNFIGGSFTTSWVGNSGSAMPLTSTNGTTWTGNLPIGASLNNDVSLSHGYGYDPATTTNYFDIQTQTRRLTVGSIPTIDGVTPSVGQLILLKDQTDAVQNGIYEVINSTTLDLIYELSVTEYARNGVWTHVTGGTTNNNTDWMLNSSDWVVHPLTKPQTWAEVTDATACSYAAPGTGGSGGPGGSGSPGTPGSCVTIATDPVPTPKITLEDPCARQYGAQTTPPVFDDVSLPQIVKIDTAITSQAVTVVYTITKGDGSFGLSGSPGSTTVSIGERDLTVTGDAIDVENVSAFFTLGPANDSKGDIEYSIVLTNADGTKVGTSCKVTPIQIVIENSQAAKVKVCVDSASTGGTGAILVDVNGFTKELTNGYVPYNTNPNTTASDIVSNINANVATKNALPVDDPDWLPAYSAALTGTGELTISAPAAGGADFNNVKISKLTTTGFVFGDCGDSFFGGVTKTISDFLKNNVPNWDKVSDVLIGIGGNVLGAVITNVIMNKVSQVEISIPTNEDVDVSFLYRGRKVQVPTEYDAAARTGHPTYAGWSGTWKTQWTQNPAWCVYDFITNKKYGLGTVFKLTSAQNTALLKDIFEIGLYCDNLVTDLDGNPQPRFSINTVITEGTRLQILEQMCSVFYGAYYTHNGGLRLTYDHPVTTVDFIVNQANASNFSKTFSSASNFLNKVKLTYVEPSNFYTESVVVAEDNNSIETYGERSAEIIAFGCTDVSQATRYAKWVLDSELKNKTVITYTGGIDHYNLRPGMIVEFHDSNERFNRRAGRIASQSGNTVTLFANPTGQIFATDLVSLTLSDGTVFQSTITSVTSTGFVMASAPPVSALPYATWIAARADFGRRLYKVIKVDEVDTAQYSVTLQMFTNDKY